MKCSGSVAVAVFLCLAYYIQPNTRNGAVFLQDVVEQSVFGGVS